jgi:hypothetical protein
MAGTAFLHSRMGSCCICHPSSFCQSFDLSRSGKDNS